ncbi:Arginine--tRNA ligase, cytoplasmic [Gossypium arboreum]|uniref:Arginine--tRNA ligase, cytoplasmic n=1 Tax=Gossypium arboreum TaxID=29729 RepID=A0A0B0MEN9_GOSAR|nr:Arginine--tRNA ligase, cytoplasmic [Gossypium arboreum]
MACNASTAVNQRKEVEEDDWRSSSSTTTTSSSWIGMNSDGSTDGGDCDEDDDEVESSYKGGLDIMDSLQQKRDLKFLQWEIQVFTNLAEGPSTSSIKEIGKPENAYTRRRRNLLAINYAWDKNKFKRPIKSIMNSRKSRLAFLAVDMGSSESISATTSDHSTSNFMPSAPALKPPLLSII